MDFTQRLENSKVLSSKEVKLLDRIKEDVVYRDWFFRHAKHIKWFYSLKEKEYFEPKNIPIDNNGNAFFWNILDYLERVSEQLAQNPEYGKELIDIIYSVVQSSIKRKKEKGQGINNYYIWWYCVKIVNNLPFKVIQDSLSVDEFRLWLSVWTDHSMGGDLTISDIGEKLLPKFLKDDYGPEYKYAEVIIEVITEI